MYFLFLFIIKKSTARASPVVILVDFLSLPEAASVLEVYPVVGSVADFTDVISWGTFVLGKRPNL